MSVVGFCLALERRLPIAIAPDLTIDVAPLAAVALLKMVAYQDRPHDRERDLEDIGHLLEEYQCCAAAQQPGAPDKGPPARRSGPCG